MKRENLTRHLIEKELDMVGKSIVDIVEDDRWSFNITMTHNQYIEFKKYSINLIKKIFKCNSKKATDTFMWFYVSFGLRIKN